MATKAPTAEQMQRLHSYMTPWWPAYAGECPAEAAIRLMKALRRQLNSKPVDERCPNCGGPLVAPCNCDPWLYCVACGNESVEREVYRALRRQLAEKEKEIARLKAELNPPFSHRGDCPGPALGVTCLACEQAKFEAWYREARENETIVEKLPKYADTGDAIAPGMELWWIDKGGEYGEPGGICVTKAVEFQILVSALDPQYQNPRCPETTYSTRQAAEASLNAEQARLPAGGQEEDEKGDDDGHAVAGDRDHAEGP